MATIFVANANPVTNHLIKKIKGLIIHYSHAQIQTVNFVFASTSMFSIEQTFT